MSLTNAETADWLDGLFKGQRLELRNPGFKKLMDELRHVDEPKKAKKASKKSG